MFFDKVKGAKPRKLVIALITFFAFTYFLFPRIQQGLEIKQGYTTETNYNEWVKHGVWALALVGCARMLIRKL
jgi:hypothetical protein